MILGGHRFYPNIRREGELAQNAQIFVKHQRTWFSFFDKLDFFLNWFQDHRQECRINNLPFRVSERVQDGLVYAFYADIEGVSPLALPQSKLEDARYALKRVIKEVYREFGLQYDHLVWMEDHRESKGKIKTSYHMIGSQDLFVDVVRRGSMHALAHDLNVAISRRVRDLNLPIEFKYDQKLDIFSVLDMSVYHSGRELRALYSVKDDAVGKGFTLCEDSLDFDLEDCFVTKDIRADECMDYDFINYESNQLKVHKKRQNLHVRRKKQHADRTPERCLTEKVLLKHIREVFKDTTSTIRFDGVYSFMGECYDQYEHKGPERKCPVCRRDHDGNRGLISDLGAGNFKYKCMSESAPPRINADIQIQKDGTFGSKRKMDYIPSFADIRSKCITIKAPMGAGKSFQTMRFLEGLPAHYSVVWVTTRKTMAFNLHGRLKGNYAIYTEMVNEDHQIIQYESLSQLQRSYNVVILDEVRSTLMNAVCSTTNKDNLVEHIETLQHLCQEAKHTVLLDADLDIDGMVDCFVQHTFNQGDVHKIEHKGAGLGYDYTLTDNYGQLLLNLKDDLTTGKVAMVCCGSASEAKAIADGARQYLDDTKIGLYHADGEQQGELLDVNKHWPNKKLIIFTSTITCSVDYQGKVDRIYAIPCVWTTSPRVLLQMIGRARNNISGEVVVFCRNAWGPSTEDLDALHRLQLRIIMEKRRRMTRLKDQYDLEFYRAITKRGLGRKAKYTPHLLVKLWAWKKVEEYQSTTNWGGKFLAMLNYKGFGWHIETSGPSTADQKEMKQEVAKNVKSNRQHLQDQLTETDSRGVSQEQLKNIVRRKNRGQVTQEELLLLRKHETQRYFKDRIDGETVLNFEKNKRGIMNRVFYKRFNNIARRKLHSNMIHLAETIDFAPIDVTAVDILVKVVNLLGFNGLRDTTTRIVWDDLSEEVLTKVGEAVEELDGLALSIRIRTTDVRGKLVSYLKNMLATQLYGGKQGGKSRMYCLKDLSFESLERIKVYDDAWLKDHCQKFDRFMGRAGDREYALISEMQEVTGSEQTAITDYTGYVGSGSKRKRENAP